MNYNIFAIILVCLAYPYHGLVVISPSAFTVSHTIARFGGDYKNETLFGIVKEVEPWDACTPIQNNITNHIALAIRGGSPLCSFSTKVKNIEQSGALAAIIMNSESSWIEADDLIEMGKNERSVNISIISIFITNASGKELLTLLHMDSQSPVIVALNSTGEEVLRAPSFWDMFITFLQLSIVLWLSIGILYGCAYLGALFQRCRRRKACRAIATVPYKALNPGDGNCECSICLEEFKEGDPVKILPCNHIFHEKCAASWIVDIRGVCPLCRQGVFQKADDNLVEEHVNYELNRLVDHEALSTHSRTLVFLFILIYIMFIVLSTLFPSSLCNKHSI